MVDVAICAATFPTVLDDSSHSVIKYNGTAASPGVKLRALKIGIPHKDNVISIFDERSPFGILVIYHKTLIARVPSG